MRPRPGKSPDRRYRAAPATERFHETEVRRRFGAWLLPQVYPEGSPLHPSYGAGHASVAGACVTMMKALFDESYVIEDPVVAGAVRLGRR